MTPKEIQSELDKCREIILSTIDYTIQKEAAQLKPEEVAYSGNFHRIWKERVEEQYHSKDLEKLTKSLDTVSLRYKIAGDLDFVKYIKEKTGFDYDLFGNIQERIEKIITRGRVANRKEIIDITTMIQLYRKTGVGQENAPVLHNLSMAFYNAEQKKKKTAGDILADTNYLCEINSPDNKRYVSMYESSFENYPATYVNIQFEDGVMSSVLAVEGINLGIRIVWSHNHTFQITLKKEARVFMKHFLKQHQGDSIRVEYIES